MILKGQTFSSFSIPFIPPFFPFLFLSLSVCSPYFFPRSCPYILVPSFSSLFQTARLQLEGARSDVSSSAGPAQTHLVYFQTKLRSHWTPPQFFPHISTVRARPGRIRVGAHSIMSHMTKPLENIIKAFANSKG